MKEKEFESMFDELQGAFDIAEPAEGHRERFLSKLNKSRGTIAMQSPRRAWPRALAVAASLAVICILALYLVQPQQSIETRVANIAPEASQTQLYFTGLIEEQVRQLQAVNTPETTTLVADTMSQLNTLEAEYKRLEQDLINGGNSNLIMQAMISNFQTRIELLQQVMNTINSINTLNTTDDENFTI